MALKGKRMVARVLLLLIVLSFASAAFAAEAEVTKSVNMREGAGTDFDTITKLRKGAVVTILDRKTDAEWWQVSFEEKEGWVSSEYLKIKRPEPQAGYATRNAQLRDDANVRSAVVDTIPPNATISILDTTENKTWWLVEYAGQEGYVQSNSVKVGTAPAAPTGGGGSSSSSIMPPANDPNADKIADAKRINSDTVGWIKVPNTNVSDPILYGPNFYYSERNIHKKKSLEGVYPYINRLSRNVVIFGHNLRGSNAGMHQLHHLQEAANGYSTCRYGSCGRSISGLKDWYKSESGRVWDISIFGKTQWEVWAMYEVPRNESISTLRNNWNTGPANMQKWIDGQLARSEIDFGVPITDRDQVMTIITCGTNYDSATANSRLFVFLKCVG